MSEQARFCATDDDDDGIRRSPRRCAITRMTRTFWNGREHPRRRISRYFATHEISASRSRMARSGLLLDFQCLSQPCKARCSITLLISASLIFRRLASQRERQFPYLRLLHHSEQVACRHGLHSLAPFFILCILFAAFPLVMIFLAVG
jgi:hypothetical protein